MFSSFNTFRIASNVVILVGTSGKRNLFSIIPIAFSIEDVYKRQEHVLLAILKDRNNVAASVLEANQVDYKKVDVYKRQI